MAGTVKLKENRNMKLTGADIEKVFSEQLENLLQQGYELVGEKKNGILGR